MDNYMLDEFVEIGTDFQNFDKITKIIDENTYYIDSNLGAFNVVSFIGKGTDEKTKKTILQLLRIDDIDWFTGKQLFSGLSKLKMSVSFFQNQKEIISEIENKNRTFIAIYDENTGNEKFAILSSLANKTLRPMEKDVSGELLNEASIKRDIALSSIFSKLDYPTKVLVRQNEKVLKIFSLFSPKHERICFHSLADATKLIDYDNIFYNINNRSVSIKLMLTTIDDFIPVIELITSDTAFVSTKINTYIKKINTDVLYKIAEYPVSCEDDWTKIIEAKNDILLYTSELFQKNLDLDIMFKNVNDFLSLCIGSKNLSKISEIIKTSIGEREGNKTEEKRKLFYSNIFEIIDENISANQRLIIADKQCNFKKIFSL